MTCKFWLCKWIGHRLVPVKRPFAASSGDGETLVCSRTGHVVSW